jgi:hypothetical protein
MNGHELKISDFLSALWLVGPDQALIFSFYIIAFYL